MSAVLGTPGQPARRRLVLGLALAASVGATLWAALSGDGDEATPVMATAPRKLVSAAAAAPAGKGGAPAPNSWPQALKTDSRQAWPAADPQARLAWGMEAVPPPPAPRNPPAPPAPPPQAPPLSYQLVGRMDDGVSGKPRAIFSNNLRTEVLGVGEVLDRQWRIEAMGPQGVQLSWLRGDQKKTLTYSSSPSP